MPMSKVQFIARPWYSCDSTAMLLFQVRNGHLVDDDHNGDGDNGGSDVDDDTIAAKDRVHLFSCPFRQAGSVSDEGLCLFNVKRGS